MKNRIGEIGYNNQGEKMTIIRYGIEKRIIKIILIHMKYIKVVIRKYGCIVKNTIIIMIMEDMKYHV